MGEHRSVRMLVEVYSNSGFQRSTSKGSRKLAASAEGPVEEAIRAGVLADEDCPPNSFAVEVAFPVVEAGQAAVEAEQAFAAIALRST